MKGDSKATLLAAVMLAVLALSLAGCSRAVSREDDGREAPDPPALAVSGGGTGTVDGRLNGISRGDVDGRIAERGFDFETSRTANTSPYQFEYDPAMAVYINGLPLRQWTHKSTDAALLDLNRLDAAARVLYRVDKGGWPYRAIRLDVRVDQQALKRAGFARP